MLKKEREKKMIEYDKDKDREKQDLIYQKRGTEKGFKPGVTIFLQGKEVPFAKILKVEKVNDRETGVARKYHLKVVDIDEIIVVTDLTLYAHIFWGEWRVEKGKIV